MAALILAVSTGKLKATEDQAYQPTMSSSPQTSDEPETTEEVRNVPVDHHISYFKSEMSLIHQ